MLSLFIALFILIAADILVFLLLAFLGILIKDSCFLRKHLILRNIFGVLIVLGFLAFLGMQVFIVPEYKVIIHEMYDEVSRVNAVTLERERSDIIKQDAVFKELVSASESFLYEHGTEDIRSNSPEAFAEFNKYLDMDNQVSTSGYSKQKGPWGLNYMVAIEYGRKFGFAETELPPYILIITEGGGLEDNYIYALEVMQIEDEIYLQVIDGWNTDNDPDNLQQISHYL